MPVWPGAHTPLAGKHAVGGVHGKHTAAFVPPVNIVNLPSLHGSHSVRLLSPALKWPSGQASQVVCVALDFTDTWRPGPHDHMMHSPPSLSLRNCPLIHSRHADSSSLPVLATYLPALHQIQSEACVLPVVDTYFATSHAIQSEASSLPVTSTYFPATQSMQSDASSLPSISTYLPTAHPVQAGAARSST
jgi:hypothetical protein